MNHRRVVRSLIVGAGVAALSIAAAGAQSATPADPRCTDLLTRDEIVAIVGSDFQGPGFMEPRPGFTNCDWLGPDASIQVGFSTNQATKDDLSTPEKTFDMDLLAVENDERKREPLDGIGLKAARVSLGDDAFLVEVQRADGVARMTFYKIAPDKILAIVRAVASP